MQLNLPSMKGFSYISFLASSGSKKCASFKGSVSERKWLTHYLTTSSRWVLRGLTPL